MLDLTKSTGFATPVEVKASDNLFTELGNNTYDYLDAISELIDNAVAKKVEGEFLQIEIEIGVSILTRKNYLLIRDNAVGICLENIPECLSPAGITGVGSLNEHGMGMKQAIASLGKLRYLATKTTSMENAILIEKFKFGKIKPKIIDVNWSHGTEICIVSLSPIVITTHLGTGYRKLVNYLGARYRRYMKPENPRISITIDILDVDTGAELWSYAIKEIRPTYFHPRKRTNQPTIFRKNFHQEVNGQQLSQWGMLPLTMNMRNWD